MNTELLSHALDLAARIQRFRVLKDAAGSLNLRALFDEATRQREAAEQELEALNSRLSNTPSFDMETAMEEALAMQAKLDQLDRKPRVTATEAGQLTPTEELYAQHVALQLERAALEGNENRQKQSQNAPEPENKAEVAEARAGMTVVRQREQKIRTRCPACHSETLAMNVNGHLFCTLQGCSDPARIHRQGESQQ